MAHIYGASAGELGILADEGENFIIIIATRINPLVYTAD
jgi:hypothetical protein